MQHSQSTSPPLPDPPMTYDEASMQRSRHFVMALQELKNLRPQLYSAAEYCESSYLFSDQKQVVLDNLKDYSVKALVNAVDHLGTVAYKLNDFLSQQTTEISTAEIRIAGLAQRIRVCQEHTNREGLKQQRINKTNRRYHKHYVLPDAVSGFKDERQENKHEKRTVPMQGAQSEQPEQPQPVHNAGRTLSWHLAADPFSTTTGSSTTLQGASRLASSGAAASEGFSVPEHEVLVHSTAGVGPSSSTRAAVSTPGSNTPPRGHGQASSFDSSKTLSSHLSFDDKPNDQHPPLQTRSKSLLSSLLGRRRSGKARS